MLEPATLLADLGTTHSKNEFGLNKFLSLRTVALAVGSIAMSIGLLVLIAGR